MTEPKEGFQWTTNFQTSAFQLKTFQSAVKGAPDWQRMRGRKLTTLEPTVRLPKNLWYD